MAEQRTTAAVGDYHRRFFTEGGEHFRRETQEIGPTIRRVQEIRDLHGQASKHSNPNEWRHIGSIPMTILIDWLKANGHTIDQWARNDGGERKVNPRGSGVKDRFMRFFLSRDFSKLHNQHTTTRRGSSQILMPGGGDVVPELRGTES